MIVYNTFAKAKHAVAKDSRKIVRTFHARKLVKARESLQKNNLFHTPVPYLFHTLWNKGSVPYPMEQEGARCSPETRGFDAHPVLSAKACDCVFAQNASRESQNASRESVGKRTCERRAH